MTKTHLVFLFPVENIFDPAKAAHMCLLGLTSISDVETKEKLSAAIVIGYREEMEGMSGRSGIVLATLLNYRRLSLGEGLDRGRGLHLCPRTSFSIVIGSDVLSKPSLSENFRRASFVRTRVSRKRAARTMPT